MHDSVRRHFLPLLCLIACVACSGVEARDEPAPPTPSSGTHASPSALSQTILDDLIAEEEPGCSAAVGVEGNVVWQGVRGFADVDTASPITPRTVFHIGSVTKQFTALAVLLLEQAGDLSTSDLLSEHLEGLPAWAKTVTLAQLMHHTSGIPEYIDLLILEGVAREDPASHAEAFRAIAAVDQLDFKPGSA